MNNDRWCEISQAFDDRSQGAGRGDHGGYENVRFEHRAHQDFSACFLAGRPARTSLTASPTQAPDLGRVGASIALANVFDRALKHATAETASSMSLERFPFFMPCDPRKARSVRSVSIESLTFQRTACSSTTRTPNISNATGRDDVMFIEYVDARKLKVSTRPRRFYENH